MRRAIAAAALPALMFTVQGCLASDVVLQVAPDGSGRAVITSRLNQEAVREVNAVLGIAPQERGTGEAEDLPAPTDVTVSSWFGGPVALESTKLEKGHDGVIRTTVVRFSDIKALHLPFPPVLQLPGGSFDLSFPGLREMPTITFGMQSHENGDRLLIVHMPDVRMEHEQPQFEKPNESPDANAPKVDRAIRRAFRGMTLRFAVELGAPLLRTNAPAHEDNTATILDVDVEKIFNAVDEEKLTRAMTPGSIQEMLWALGDIAGTVTPVDRDVFLEFAPPAPQAAPVQAAPPPDTDVFLAPLTRTNGRLEIGAAVNISNNRGYDNQPSFTPDGASILFTSVRDGAQSDIYRYDIGSGRVSQVTATPESEYSPTITPSGDLSVVRVELDREKTQRLWRFDADGRNPHVVLESIKPVGYHAWADDHTVALFVLGQPATLQVADTRTGAARIVATDIGRSLRPIPGGHTVSFVQRERHGDAAVLVIKELDPFSGEIRTLISAVQGGTEADVAWTPDGTLLMAHHDTLYAWRRGERDWTAVGPLGVRGVTRLAVSPRGDRIAVVANP